PVAVPGAAMARAGADAWGGDIAAGRPLHAAGLAHAEHAGLAERAGAPVAGHALWRDSGGDAQSGRAVDDDLAGPVPGSHRIAAASGAEHSSGLAADGQPDCGDDPVVCRWLRSVPTAGGARLRDAGKGRNAKRADL